MKAHVLTDAAPPSRRFRRLLQEELALRCARNPRYSLRAFARYLGLDHSTLSQLLRGRRRFTRRTIERVGKRLALAPEMITQFVELERTPTEPWTSRELRQLSRDAALTLAEWYHHAILKLTRLTSFRYSATTVAVTTSTSRRIADCVERFRREVTDLLEQDAGDRDQVYCLELAFFPVADLTTMES